LSRPLATPRTSSVLTIHCVTQSTEKVLPPQPEANRGLHRSVSQPIHCIQKPCGCVYKEHRLSLLLMSIPLLPGVATGCFTLRRSASDHDERRNDVVWLSWP
jgi:hypothetical protein